MTTLMKIVRDRLCLSKKVENNVFPLHYTPLAVAIVDCRELKTTVLLLEQTCIS